MGRSFYGKELPPTHLRAMAYGPVGTGKTTFALTLPDPFMLALQWEGGVETARGKDVAGYVAEDWEEVESVVDKFCGQYKQKGFRSFVFDGLSFARKLLEDHVKGRKSEMTMQLWGTFSKRVEAIIHKLASCEDAHVIFTAHVDEQKADGGGIIAGKVLWPGTSGKVTIPGTMTELLFMDVVKVKGADGKLHPVYRTFFRKKGVYDARIRYAPREFPDYADNLTFPKLVRLLARHGIAVAGAEGVDLTVSDDDEGFTAEPSETNGDAVTSGDDAAQPAA